MESGSIYLKKTTQVYVNYEAWFIVKSKDEIEKAIELETGIYKICPEKWEYLEVRCKHCAHRQYRLKRL